MTFYYTASQPVIKLLQMGAGCIVSLVGMLPGNAAVLTHTPTDRIPPVVMSPAFGPLASGGAVGTAFIDFGVDYSAGTVEGIFNDVPVRAFAGVNANGIVDLLTPVDGRIVLPGSTAQGLTRFIAVEAGLSEPGNLLLQVFDLGGNPLASTLSNTTIGSTDRSRLFIDRGTADIASFRVSFTRPDFFGVTLVSLEQPIAASTSVPTPALLPGLMGLAIGIWRQRKAD